MLRITTCETSADGLCLILEGGLAGPWVAELQAACDAAGESHPSVRLDLSRVHYVDADGLALLRALLDGGAALRAVSPFVEELLQLRRTC